MKIIFTILFAAIFISILSSVGFAGTTQDLTYDNPTNQVNISYDALNRILTKNTSSENITYGYDQQYDGTLSNITFTNSTYEYEYDDRLRVIRESKTIDGIVFEKRSYYDSMDRLIKQTLSPGNETNYIYNNQSQIGKILNFITNSFYNPFDKILNRTYVNSGMTNFTYDDSTGRLTRIQTDTIQDLNYTYDAVGNIILINETAYNRTYRMVYDFLDRLVNTTINEKTWIYSYNSIGNILKIVRDGTDTTKFVYGANPVHAPLRILEEQSGIELNRQQELSSSNNTRYYEFYLANEKNATLTNVNWTIELGNGSSVDSNQNFNITTNESILVVFENNYTSPGEYKINFTAKSSDTSVDFENFTVRFGVLVDSISILQKDITNVSYQFVVRNTLNRTSQSISWNCNNGVSSSSDITLNGLESRRINASYNYSSPGTKSLSCSVVSADGNDTKSVNFDLAGVRIEDYSRTMIDTKDAIVNFTIRNYYYGSTIEWEINSDGQTFDGNLIVDQNSSDTVSQRINYTSVGVKDIAINISLSNITDVFNETFTISALGVEDYSGYVLNLTDYLLEFTVRNYWSTNLTVNWNVSSPIITSNSPIELNGSESVFVFIESNYTTQGKKRPTITAYNSSSTSIHSGSFLVKMIESLTTLTLFESTNSTIFEIVARSNFGQQVISWILNTTQENVASSQTTSLNGTESVFIIIETNYTGTGIYPADFTINSSSFNDTSSGISIT